MIPDVELTSDVAVAEAAEIAESAVNYSEKNLAELVALFEELVQNEERMKMSKDAEAIKAAFYKRLLKEKSEVNAEEAEEGTENPFAAVEAGFKDLYNKYRKERSEFNMQLEKER